MEPNCPDDHSSVTWSAHPTWVGNSAFVSLIASVDEEILTENNHATWTIRSTRNCRQLVSSFIDWVTRTSLDRIQTEIHFIDGQEFGSLASINTGIFILPISVIHLQSSKHSIIVPCVQSRDIKYDGMRLRSLQWRGDTHVLIFSVEDVHELILFDRGQHECASFGVTGQHLTRYYSSRGIRDTNSSATGLAICFLKHFHKRVLLPVI